MMNFPRSFLAPTVADWTLPSELELLAVVTKKHVASWALEAVWGNDELAQLANELVNR